MRNLFPTLLFMLITVSTPTLADPLFESRDLLELTINADYKLLMKGRDKSVKHPATLTYDSNKGPTTLDIKLQLRGNFRLNNCALPGLKLIFEDQSEGLFLNQKKLKLVTQCKRGSGFQDYLLQEYAIYRGYELLTHQSFKTRLVRVTYVDGTGNRKDLEQFAFLIEDKNRLAARLSGEPVEKNRIAANELAPEPTNLSNLYQYFIGNTDYSLLKGEGEEACCHNTKLISSEAGYIPIPYDFDLAGMINTNYAAPPVGLKINKVTQRLYRGFCRNNELLERSTALFNDQKQPLYDVFADGRVRKKARAKMQRFIDKFYDIINNPAKIEKDILADCR